MKKINEFLTEFNSTFLNFFKKLYSRKYFSIILLFCLLISNVFVLIPSETTLSLYYLTLLFIPLLNTEFLIERKDIKLLSKKNITKTLLLYVKSYFMLIVIFGISISLIILSNFLMNIFIISQLGINLGSIIILIIMFIIMVEGFMVLWSYIPYLLFTLNREHKIIKRFFIAKKFSKRFIGINLIHTILALVLLSPILYISNIIPFPYIEMVCQSTYIFLICFFCSFDISTIKENNPNFQNEVRPRSLKALYLEFKKQNKEFKVYAKEWFSEYKKDIDSKYKKKINHNNKDTKKNKNTKNKDK